MRRTAAGQSLFFFRLFGQCSIGVLLGFGLFLFERRGFSHFDGDGVLGAVGQTVAETVAVVFTDQLGFAVDEGEGSFGTGVNAESAAVTAVFIYFDHFSFHKKESSLFF